MAKIVVTGNALSFVGNIYRCAVGRSGFSSHKKEGDGCTPTGAFYLRECWYRADRLSAPATRLPLRIIRENDGWCDDPKSGEYNRHIIIPPPLEGGGKGVGLSEKIAPLPNPPPQGGREYSYETLFRADHAYDLIIPMSYNDDPVVPGKGSAIFLHVAKEDYAPTEGCVALALKDLLAILPELATSTVIEITP